MKAWRQRAVLGALMALAVWPMVHIVLAYQFDVNPWKLAGWGMYATPFVPGPGIRLFEVMEGEPKELELGEVVGDSKKMREALSDFLKRRAVFGRLAEPADLAQQILAQGGAEHLLVRVETRFIDRKTGERATKATDYRYSRPSS